jgi:hypothetical protein
VIERNIFLQRIYDKLLTSGSVRVNRQTTCLGPEFLFVERIAVKKVLRGGNIEWVPVRIYLFGRDLRRVRDSVKRKANFPLLRIASVEIKQDSADCSRDVERNGDFELEARHDRAETRRTTASHGKFGRDGTVYKYLVYTRRTKTHNRESQKIRT